MEGQKGSDGVYLLRDDKEVKLDLEALESYSIYPGMICAFEGNNPTGDLFIATKIIPQEPPKIPEADRQVEDTSKSRKINIFKCRGFLA